MRHRYHISSIGGDGKHWVLADQLAVSGTSFFTIILVARGLDATAFTLLTFILLAQLLLLTVQNAVITGPYAILRADESNPRDYIHSLFFLQLLFIGLIAVAGLVLYFSNPSWIHPFKADWWWTLLMMAAFLLQDLLRKIFIVEKKAAMAFAIDILTSALQLSILLALFISRQLTLKTCLIVMGTTFIPSVTLGIWRIGFRIPPSDAFRRTLLAHFQHGRWLLATSILQWWAGNSFTVSAGILMGVTAFGALRLAQNVFGMINVLLQAFENYVLPRAAGIYRQSSTQFHLYLRKKTASAGLIIGPCLLLIALLAKPLFLLIGGIQYSPFYRTLWELSILYFFIFLSYPIRMAIRILRLNRAFFLAYLLSSLLSVLFASPLIRQWGIEGALAGLLINQLAMMACWFFILYKKNFYGNNTHCPGES